VTIIYVLAFIVLLWVATVEIRLHGFSVIVQDSERAARDTVQYVETKIASVTGAKKK
jgi:hypothetical protein